MKEDGQMAFFQWDDKYSVKIQEIDEQHRKLFAYINEMYEAMKVGKGREVLGAVLAGLLNYTKEHFAAEEKLMHSNGYPAYHSHKSQHDAFTRKIMEFEEQLRAKDFALSIEVSRFLKEWLQNHILRTDMRYVPYLNSKDVKLV
jgi:hemerythrin-like metal-binding protein